MSSTAATSCWTCCTTSFWKAAHAWASCASTKARTIRSPKRLCGYLLCRGGVHQLAYAVALSKITGVDVPKMLPIPDIRTDKIPECREFIEKGLHRSLYRFSADDYKHHRRGLQRHAPRRRPAAGSARRHHPRSPAGRPAARSGLRHPVVRHGRAERNHRPLDEETCKSSADRRPGAAVRRAFFFARKIG